MSMASHSTAAMTRLNSDVLALIIGAVDDTHTLFSLLMVSKQAFSYSCPILYRDPATCLNRLKADNKHEALVRFIKMALVFSPACDSLTNLVRQIFGVKQADKPPMFDYLSLIRVVRWPSYLGFCVKDTWTDYLSNTPGLSLPDYSYPDSIFFVKNSVAAAICHHQLGSIVEMEIPFSMIEDYINRASKLSRLEKIYICDTSISPPKTVHSSIVRLVKAIQQHHGPDQLRECHVDDKAYTQPSRHTIPFVCELLSLLPNPAVLKQITMESSRLMDRYLARLENFCIRPSNEDLWLHLLQHYAGSPPGRILQCCRGLINLNIDQGVCIQDRNLLGWAAQEARDRAHGKPTPPAVPLQNFRLWMEEENPGDTLTVLRDALIGFGSSLTHCQVVMSMWASSRSLEHDSIVDVDICNELVELPKMASLAFKAQDPTLFDPRLLLVCPRLESMSLDLDDVPPTGLPMQRWPLSSHPHLTYLRMQGMATNAFDPRAFADMPSLATLEIEQSYEDPSPDRTMWMERWTWDWHLPQLRDLTIYCAIEGWFSLKILRTCPSLASLGLHSIPKQILQVAAVLDDPNHDSFKNLDQLSIVGKWDVTPSDLYYLLRQVLPKLSDVELYSLDSCNVFQVLEATRHHPTLKSVRLPRTMVSLDEREKLGFCEKGENNKDRCVYSLRFPDKFILSDE